MRYRVVIPAGVKAGQILPIYAGDTLVHVVIPKKAVPGTTIVFYFPVVAKTGTVQITSVTTSTNRSTQASPVNEGRRKGATTSASSPTTTSVSAPSTTTDTNALPSPSSSAATAALSAKQIPLLMGELFDPYAELQSAVCLGVWLGLSIVVGFLLGVLYVTEPLSTRLQKQNQLKHQLVQQQLAKEFPIRPEELAIMLPAKETDVQTTTVPEMEVETDTKVDIEVETETDAKVELPTVEGETTEFLSQQLYEPEQHDDNEDEIKILDVYAINEDLLENRYDTDNDDSDSESDIDTDDDTDTDTDDDDDETNSHDIDDDSEGEEQLENEAALNEDEVDVESEREEEAVRQNVEIYQDKEKGEHGVEEEEIIKHVVQVEDIIDGLEDAKENEITLA